MIDKYGQEYDQECQEIYRDSYSFDFNELPLQRQPADTALNYLLTFQLYNIVFTMDIASIEYGVSSFQHKRIWLLDENNDITGLLWGDGQWAEDINYNQKDAVITLYNCYLKEKKIDELEENKLNEMDNFLEKMSVNIMDILEKIEKEHPLDEKLSWWQKIKRLWR